uniref:Uncharacterized protein n=1 Tax=Caenorhabditis japonica TaxID=281687 RepID=A0A8R1EL43_CAEJA
MTRFTPEGEEFFAFEPGDILRIRGAFGSVYQGRLGVTVNWHAECKKSGEFTMTFSETPRITDLPLPPGTVDPRIRRHL